MSALLRRIFQAFLFPQTCVLCEQWVQNLDLSPLCSLCASTLKPLSSPVCDACGIPLPGCLTPGISVCSKCRAGHWAFDGARAWGLYQGHLRRLIHHFKFKSCPRLASPLAGLLLDCLENGGLEFSTDWIVPVPLHSSRRRERGFDQTLLLSRGLSRRTGIPIFRGLRRIRRTPAQFGLDDRSRRRNVRGAFDLKQAGDLVGKSVLVIDDVITTGATVQEISVVLRRRSQVERINVLALARVPRLYWPE